MKREHRSRALNLLCDFVQSQPPHLYQVLQTPLFDNIVRCLQIDTSTTVVSLALTALIMLLPNVMTSIVSHLPALFNIYARLLFWDRERSIEVGGSGTPAGAYGSPADSTWETCVHTPDVDDGDIPHLLGYFTILYGLYPINFVEYIRKPQRYLRHAKVPDADDIEVQPSEIRHRSERYRQWHLLHRNFYNLTLESEKTDFGRWIRSEPADVVAECVALCLAEAGPGYPFDAVGISRTASPAAVESAEDDAAEPALLSGSMILPTPESRPSRPASGESPSSSRAQSTLLRRGSQSSHQSARNSADARTREAGFDSPTLPPQLVVSPSHTDLQDMIDSNKVIKAGLRQSLANDSVPSLSLSHHDSASEKVPARSPAQHAPVKTPASTPDTGEQLTELRRQILLLKNDLGFERYLKQQHMNHIGTLRRRQVREAASEADTQNLIMANRNLKQRLEDAKKTETQVRKESEKSRTLSKKWEDDLSAKLRTLREEQKKWVAERAALQRFLDETREENEKLRKMVCDAEVRETTSQHALQSIEGRGHETDWLKEEVARLEKATGDKQARERDLESARHDALEAGGQAEALRMELTAQASDTRRMVASYESQIVVLNARLSEAQRSRRAADVEANPVVESALAASRAKQLELQKQLSLLTRKYTVLQSSLLELTSNAHLTRSRTDPAASSNADAEVSAILGTPRGRTQRVLTEPELGEGSSYNATPPTDSFGLGTSVGTVIHRPSTPTSSTRLEQSTVGSTSPERERYYGRGERKPGSRPGGHVSLTPPTGGVQNATRKDRKDKKPEPEKPEKKEKKSSGIRGIRGFG